MFCMLLSTFVSPTFKVEENKNTEETLVDGLDMIQLFYFMYFFYFQSANALIWPPSGQKLLKYSFFTPSVQHMQLREK